MEAATDTLKALIVDADVKRGNGMADVLKNCGYNPVTAEDLMSAKMLADYDIVWFEEALPPDDIEGYIELTKQSPVPIATGEVLTRRQSFMPWLERRAVDIVQPDCCKNGGLSESRRIGWMAHDHNIVMVSHGWNTAVGLAADLQLAAAMPIARYVEYLTPCDYIENITCEKFEIDDEGFLKIPDKPGLGIELDHDKLKRYRME